MGKKYIEDNLEILRKQRDDKVKGGYRDLVVKTYNYIEKNISRSRLDYSVLRNREISKGLFQTFKEEAKIRGFVNDLRKSDYLSVENIDDERRIKILKKINF